MNLFNGKGMSVNVNLSDEQMEYISDLTADKVNKTRTHYMNETEVLQREVQDLRREIERRDRITVEDILRDNSYKARCVKLFDKNKKLIEENEELKVELDKYKTR